MSAHATPRGRVLIVDDEPELLEGMKMLFEVKGMDVIFHSSMITLPLILRDADPDVILLDVSLPALSGTSALRSGLRRLLKTDGALVLFSGRSENELTVIARDLGADGFITKSDEPMEIVGDYPVAPEWCRKFADGFLLENPAVESALVQTLLNPRASEGIRGPASVAMAQISRSKSTPSARSIIPGWWSRSTTLSSSSCRR